ncbi:NAD(P)-dependent oxidoreductase [Novosphingobium sp. fls2-241-R2A-195]|uniref:NAD-dependent epimerase/dehydratase family protein n=1 Tax=Novosphingobium sp. fls2-241-R2A-195 TaxID=3040296 RepID=UPI00254FF8B8|nr:NAD(P)-dependent oxidoreductase [Novosphingobium sp. fls2-241-R2A-195]
MSKIFLTGASGFIGAEIIRIALADGHQVANFDIAEPHYPGQLQFWQHGDVRDAAAVKAAISQFAPDYVIHLASDTDVSITELDQFKTTIDGTRNVTNAVAELPMLARFVHISTQFTVRPGITPRDEQHLEPYTIYGEAKAETERIVRGAALPVPWIIIRPTIIWGPHHPSFADNIFRHIRTRAYLHPTGSGKIIRAFGYVENTADQIYRLALDTQGKVTKSVYYVGDEALDYDLWADAFSIGLSGKKARRIPVAFLTLMGKVGDIFHKIGLPAPIDSGRAFRMSTSSAIDLSPTLDVTGAPPVSFDDGVKATLSWLADKR